MHYGFAGLWISIASIFSLGIPVVCFEGVIGVFISLPGLNEINSLSYKLGKSLNCGQQA
jgi:hypothetical protein